MVRNLPMQETWVRSLGQEDSLEKGMATHSSIFAQRISWTEEPGGLKSDVTEGLIFSLTLFKFKYYMLGLQLMKLGGPPMV